MARRTVSLHVALLGGAALALLMGCQREAAPQPAVSSCPPAPACSSDCPPEGSGLVRPVAGPVAVPTVFAPPAVPELQASGEIGELSASASRKMFHDDGAGCLADLERIAKLQPSLDKQMAAIRGQCEMLVGKCQEGKKRIADYFVVETNMSPERAAMTAEQMGSMRCRGGNSTPRDELLRAFYELSDGAYMNKREPAFCRERVATIRRLGPTVPAGPEDSQIDGGRKALFYTAAACFVKAGDCAGGMAAYRDNYPYENLGAVPNPQDRDKLIREGFASSFAVCGGGAP
jgi:hypothetical protein